MAKQITFQTSFTSGELSEEVFGRVDKEFYFNGAAELRNVYVSPLGGVYKREGMRMLDDTYLNEKVKLVSFSFNTEQRYLLVFSNQRMRVYKDDLRVAEVTNEVLNKITTENLPYIKHVQSADTLILVDEHIKPIKITRQSDTEWTVEHIEFDFIPTYPFSGTTNTEPAATITFSSLLGRGVTVTASADVFTSDHVKQEILAKTGGIFKILKYVGAREVEGQVLVEFPGDNDGSPKSYASGRWELSTGYEDVWSDTRGYPRTCCFYQSRLWFGGSGSRPATVWASQTAEFFNFNVGGAAADDAIDITLSDDLHNGIVNIFPGRNMQIFTTGGEYYIPQSETEPIQPDNIIVQRSTLHGSSNVRPVSVDGSTIFIEESGRVVREFLFNELERSYNAKSISLVSSHIVQSPVAMSVRQSRVDNPADYVYCVNSDGTLGVLNILREQQLLAWSLLTTKGKVEDLTVVGREVYLCVEREIDGVSKRFIEKLDGNYYLDSSVKITGSTPASTFTGFSHLANEQVKVKADTFVLPEHTVSEDGEITLEEERLEVEAGIGFDVVVKALPVLPVGLSPAIASGQFRRVISVNLRVADTQGFKVISGNNTYFPSFRSLGKNVLGKPLNSFTGWKKIFISGGISRDSTFTIVQENPVDFSLLAMQITVSL